MALTTVGNLMIGGGTPITQNIQTISVSYTIPASNNAMSVGPITLSSGVTVTVPSGSRWVVL